MEPLTITAITAVIGTLIAVGTSYAKNNAQVGEEFSLTKTIIVILASGGLLTVNYVMHGVLLDSQTVFAQVMAFTGFGLAANASVKAVAAKSETVGKVVSKLEGDPILTDFGTSILPTEQSGVSPYTAQFTVLANPGCTQGPNRITEIEMNFGDGTIQVIPVANGIAQFTHVYTHSGNTGVYEEMHDIDYCAKSAAGKTCKVLDQDDPSRFAARVGVKRQLKAPGE